MRRDEIMKKIFLAELLLTLASIIMIVPLYADVYQDMYPGDSPLHDATKAGDIAAIRYFIEHGVNVNAKDSYPGGTPLHYAALKGQIEVVALLIQRGANVNAMDNDQESPLHYAARNGQIEVAKLLIEKGADMNVKDRYGDTPVVVAEKHKHPEFAKLISRQSGKLSSPPTIPQEARDEMTKGMAAFKLAKRSEDFAEAEDHFKKAVSLAPWLPEPYFNLALAQEKLALARGQQDTFLSAKNSLEKYLLAVTDPRDAQAGKQKMAELDLQKKRYDEFAHETNLGIDAYKKGPNGYNDATKHLGKAIEIYPDNPQADMACSSLGQVYMYQGDLDAAYKYMQKSFELAPEPSDHPERYTNMGWVLEKRGDRAKACIYYKKGCDHGNKIGCGNMSNCP